MEAVVIIIPPIIALLIGAWAVFAPRALDPVAEQARLDQHIARLEESLARARADNGDEQMITNLPRQAGRRPTRAKHLASRLIPEGPGRDG